LRQCKKLPLLPVENCARPSYFCAAKLAGKLRGSHCDDSRSEAVRRRFLALILAGLVSTAAIPAFAAPIPVITIDENGNGFVDNVPLLFAFTNDPGPGGQPGVLTYLLPFPGVQGDVLLNDPDLGFVLDVLRFNGDGTVIFYSDNIDGFDSLADTSSGPTTLYANNITIDEIGSETDNGAFYTPGPLDPGAPGVFGNATYTFNSDGAGPVPEPATLVLLGTGLFGLAGLLRRKRLRR
jgi:hypothetical protein